MSSLSLLPSLALAFGMLQLPPEQKAAASPTDKWKVDFKLVLERKNGEWVFAVEGTTNIPKEVVLRARVYAVEIVNDFQQGKREDEEPLVWDDEDAQPSFKVIDAVGGKFREEVYRFARKPWSILYRARIHYRPRDQDGAVLKKFGDDDFSRHADLRVGTDQDFAVEMKDRVKEATDDLVSIYALFKEIKRKFDEHLKKHEPAAWKAWKDGWFGRVQKIGDCNKERYNLWAVWMERQAKMRVGGMCELLRRILVACGEKLEDASKKLEPIQDLLAAFEGYLEEAPDAMGISFPLDPDKVGPVIAEYEKAYAAIRGELSKAGGDVAVDLGGARRDGLGALLQLPPMLKNRKSAYKLVNDISVRFRKLLELTDAKPSPEALKKALEDHDTALRDFKKYAGLK